MAYDPSDPRATAAAVADPSIIPPTATMTFAEWCAADPGLVDADKAAFSAHYGEMASARIAAREESEAAMDAAVGSAFVQYYGSRADQKMDRATLEARIASMVAELEAVAPPPAE
jgi:hypothetical protein